MSIRFTFRMEAYVEGETIEEIKEKYSEIICRQTENGADFVETVSVEDGDTYEDLWNKFYEG